MRANWVRMAAIGAAVGGLTAGSALAQDALVRLTLDDALARGLEASHRLAEMGARVEASEAREAGRDAADRPQIALVGGYTRTNHIDEFGVPQSDGSLRVIFPDIPDNYRARLDLAWPIYTWGRTDALVRAARAEAAAAGRELETARADLRLEITRAYWALVTARETVAVLDQALRRTDAHLTDVRNRRAVGLVPPNEVLSAEAQRAHQQVQLIEARNRADAVASDLRRLVGLAPGTPIDLDVTLTPASLPGDPDPALVEEARAARPERQAITHRLDAAAAVRTATAADARPQVSLTGGVDYARPNPRILPRRAEWDSSWDVAVSVSWSLWDGGRVSARVAEAAAVERAARERLLDFDAALETDVRQQRLDLASSLAAIAAAEAGIRAAADARRVVTERFQTGVATNTEVLDAQVALLEAELDRTRTIAGSRLAEARLNRALGREVKE